MQHARNRFRTLAASLLALLVVLSGLAMPLPANAESGGSSDGTVVIDSQTTWKYLDDNTDPAEGLSSRTAWTEEGFNDSAWKSGIGSFGAKNGAIRDLGGGCTPKTLLNQYISGTSNDIPTFFFRSTFEVSDASKVTSILGSVLYDDNAIVYINGQAIANFEGAMYDSNLSYGGSNAGSPKTGTISLTDSAAIGKILKNGTNTIAVELHNGRASSSDIYFDFQNLTLSTTKITATQDSVSLAPGSDESKVNVNWYASTSEAGKVRYAKTSEVVDGKLPDSAKEVTAETASTNRSGMTANKAAMTDLEPGTAYSYQLVNGDTESQLYHFNTQAEGAFTFLFVGDPQIGAGGSTEADSASWANSLKVITGNYPNAAFLLSAGDQVNSAADENQYAGYLNSTYMPYLINPTVVGNHDTSSAAYDQHFNVANRSGLGSTAASSDAWFTYNGVLFLQLNDNNMSTAEHKQFMENAIKQNPNAKWKVAVMHHSVFSVANHAFDSDVLQRRSELVPVFRDLDIDVVLMGHDHVYVRSYMMDGENPITDPSAYDDDSYSSTTNPDGILYVTANSGSGSKYYNIKNEDFPYARVKNQEYTPNVSVISVSDNEFKITTKRISTSSSAKSASGSSLSDVDSFTIYHYKEADYSKVDEAVKKAESLNADDYKDFSAVTDAVNAVKRGKLENEQSVVDGYADAINKAIDALEKKESEKPSDNPSENPTNPTNPSDNPSGGINHPSTPSGGNGSSASTSRAAGSTASKADNGSRPNTGDASSIAMDIVLLLAACAGTVGLVILRRRNGHSR